ncbi:MAG: methionyl-tRNA formyltransferase [Paludibacteraceae bacterium]|nr:methionyl-tRNA formyltransferase [Paludibacteraceae bacterium]
MEKKDLKIVYMGTPEFAVEPLKTLVENGYNIVGVITMPDKPAGRGHKIQYSPIKEYAIENNLRLLQPEKLKDEGFIEELKSLNADLQIVVAFRMLPEVVWGMPKLGTFNLHASLLPQYRGAAPINWAIINGEEETGITTFFLTHEIDTGKIIQQEKIEIKETDNVGIIHDKLMYKGSELVVETVEAILNGTIHPKPQEELYSSEADLKAAPKIFKETCKIDFSKSKEEIYNLIRGLSPYPAAWAELSTDKGPLVTKIYETEKIDKAHQLPIGSVETDGKKTFDVAVKDGFIRIKALQLQGKKRLSTEDFLKGFRPSQGMKFM